MTTQKGDPRETTRPFWTSRPKGTLAIEELKVILALNGVGVIIVSLVGGLLLYRAILKDGNATDWHLLHAGGSARGIMLLALAGMIHLPALSFWQLWTANWLIIFFVWTSTLAMILRAITGERGFGLSGSTANKLIYILYAAGTAAVFPGFVWLAIGLLKAL